jgi:hypothetical protein
MLHKKRNPNKTVNATTREKSDDKSFIGIAVNIFCHACICSIGHILHIEECPGISGQLEILPFRCRDVSNVGTATKSTQREKTAIMRVSIFEILKYMVLSIDTLFTIVKGPNQ